MIIGVCFFAGALALALHHHDIPLALKQCVICKAKNSTSGTLKVKVALSDALAGACAWHAGLDINPGHVIPSHPESLIAIFCPTSPNNKAPPLAC
jgi:hypothetical protein